MATSESSKVPWLDRYYLSNVQVTTRGQRSFPHIPPKPQESRLSSGPTVSSISEIQGRSSAAHLDERHHNTGNR
eukprot:11106788-Ditylum_brightwellii.AAC.1